MKRKGKVAGCTDRRGKGLGEGVGAAAGEAGQGWARAGARSAKRAPTAAQAPLRIDPLMLRHDTPRSWHSPFYTGTEVRFPYIPSLPDQFIQQFAFIYNSIVCPSALLYYTYCPCLAFKPGGGANMAHHTEGGGGGFINCCGPPARVEEEWRCSVDDRRQISFCVGFSDAQDGTWRELLARPCLKICPRNLPLLNTNLICNAGPAVSQRRLSFGASAPNRALTSW